MIVIARCRKCATEAGRGRLKCSYCGNAFILEPGDVDPRIAVVENQIARQKAQREADQFLCDFCSSPDVGYGAVSAPFDIQSPEGVPPFPHTSVDDWACCPTCAALVDAGDKHGLLARSGRTFLERHPELAEEFRRDPRLEEMCRQTLREAHEKFWKYFMGEIVDLTSERREHYRKVRKECEADNRIILDQLKRGEKEGSA